MDSVPVAFLFNPRPITRLAAMFVLVAVLASVPATVRAQDPQPASARLNGMRHVYQTWNNCSGANLTMALSYYGWGYDQDVARSWLKPDVEDKNVSPGEMADFVNHEQTSLPNIRAFWRYGGTIDLLKRFIAAGFPIIAESGYDVEDLGWMGHYETVVAYDDSVQTVWVYDSYLGLGDGSGMTHTYADFDYWWRHFNRAFVVLFPLEREEEVRQILGAYLDPMFAAEQALNTALTEAAQDQTDAWAWFNAGTSAVKLGRYHDAAIYFDEAFRQGLPYRLTWYMFGPYEAYYMIGRYQDVIDLANNTESTTEYVEETRYWRGMAYAALGRYDEAVTEFNAAISFNPHFVAAVDAKTQVESQTFVAPGAPQ
jgi:tetratricopeptide (TPR) repeat protein